MTSSQKYILIMYIFVVPYKNICKHLILETKTTFKCKFIKPLMTVLNGINLFDFENIIVK